MASKHLGLQGYVQGGPSLQLMGEICSHLLHPYTITRIFLTAIYIHQGTVVTGCAKLEFIIVSIAFNHYNQMTEWL